MRKLCKILITLSLVLTLFFSMNQSTFAQTPLELGKTHVIAIKKEATFEFSVPNFSQSDIRHVENSQPEKASISGFTITALQYGTTTFLVYFNNPDNENDEQFVRIEVNVLDGIAFESQSIEIDLEETRTVNVVTNPVAEIEKLTVNYSSTDETIVTVNKQGAITGLAEGTAIIEADFYGFKARLQVIVKNIPDFTFDQPSLNLNLYSSVIAPYTISIHGGRDKSIRWSSDDEAIVQVDSNGWITAIGTGSTNIVATVLNQEYILPVNVLSGVIDFVINETTVTLERGETYQLNWSVTPASQSRYGVTWMSSKTSVAAVNNGLITANSPGQTIIYGRVDDIVRQVEVNVLISVDNISVLPKSLEIAQNEEVTLSVIYSPSNTTVHKNPVFSSADETIAIVDENGVVTGISPGTTTIFITDHGFSITAPVTVTRRSDASGNSFLIGQFIDADTVTFEVDSIDDFSSIILEIPFHEAFTNLQAITLNVIMNEELLNNRLLVAKGLFANKAYQGKTVYLNVMNDEKDFLFKAQFEEFELINTNLFVSLQADMENVNKRASSDRIIQLPFDVRESHHLQVYNDEEIKFEELYLYQIESNYSLNQLDDDFKIRRENDNSYVIPQVSSGLYLISHQNNVMILNDLLIYLVSGLVIVIVTGFLIYKVREIRKIDKIEQEKEYGID